MRSKASERGRVVKVMQRDLSAGENPWNGMRGGTDTCTPWVPKRLKSSHPVLHP